MFRVTQRLGVVILMCVLVVNGIFFTEILGITQNSKLRIQNSTQNLKLKYAKILVSFLLILYAIISLFEFYIPVKISNVSSVPPVYEFLSRIDDPEIIIATYPNQGAEDIFWITRHKKRLINPRAYKNPEFNFDANLFTKNLSTTEGLLEAKKLDVSYIVFYKSQNNLDETFFNSNLYIEKDFGSTILYKL
jgi:hypothetical protein